MTSLMTIDAAWPYGTGSNGSAVFLARIGDQSLATPANWLVLSLGRPNCFVSVPQTAPDAVTGFPASPQVGKWLQEVDGLVSDQEAGQLAREHVRMLNELRTHFDATVSLMARTLLMARSGLYKWYAGSVPHAGTGSRLRTLHEFSREWHARNLPALRLVWDRKLSATDPRTVGAVLEAAALDVNALRAVLDALSQAAAEPKVRKRLGFPNRKRSLEKDLERLGPEVSISSSESED